MRTMRFFAPTLLCLLLACSHFLLVPNQALAKHRLPWCGCGMCYMAQYGNCTCGYPYYWCFDDQNSSPFHTSFAPSLANTSPIISEDLPSPIARMDGIDSGGALMRGQRCLRNRLTFNLLGTGPNDRKFAPVPVNKMILMASLLEAEKNE